MNNLEFSTDELASCVGVKPKNRAINFKHIVIGILKYKFAFKMQLLGKGQYRPRQMGRIFLFYH